LTPSGIQANLSGISDRFAHSRLPVGPTPCPDYRAIAIGPFDQLLKALEIRAPYSEDQLVEWTGLERICNHFVAAATAVEHPIGVRTMKRCARRACHPARD
jgi:hypothetical protein